MAENPHFAFGRRGVVHPTSRLVESISLPMTTGLTLQHLYSQQQYSQQPSNGPSGNAPPMSSHSMTANNGHNQQQRHLPSNSANKQHSQQQGLHPHHHHHHMNNMNVPSHHGGQNVQSDDFVADPLPFNYEDIETSAVFDDRYGGRGMMNRSAGSNGVEKSNHAQQHPIRYGSLLAGMQQHQSHYHESPSYNDGNSSLHHPYEGRRDNTPLERNGHNKEASSYHYIPHSHTHSEQETRSSSHYGVPDIHSSMGHNNLHSIYHQAPPSYAPPSSVSSSQAPPHSSHSYASLMGNHHTSTTPTSTMNSSVAPKKELPPSYHGDYLDSRSHSSSLSHIATTSSLSHLSSSNSTAAQSQTQEAVIKIKTTLKNKYWRNGRRNLQCFPSCKVFGDYSQIKIEDLKQHDFMWGKCRGSLIAEVTLNSNATFDDILLLGRVHSLENIPVPFDEAVIRECMIGRVVEPDVMDKMKENWIAGERLPDFINQNNNMACYEFKPKVWKYTDDMVHGKCKRRNVRYYVQFEAFVPVLTGDRRCYVCIGSGMSSSFEVGSSRVLARQKRKANNTGEEEDDEKDSNEDYDQNESGNSRPTKKVANPVSGYSI